ncbi:sigma-54-dependent Fis family transcriptional regulator [Paraburkholderia domus]|uniref:sigma-54-dependent Fis family transcriptional regulator n=1 Tax=Paraburkholderia domus TaxID=2793075 RepID=UPI001AFF5955|nr:sigma-54-dependent Fis family transcriptional regulator [Paraburkholderia domus]CAE6841327.1 Acetoin catabolism regulatory protein [Paraburkholderia domus]
MQSNLPTANQVNAAREHVLEGRSLAAGIVPEFVVRSWARSRNYGLSVSDQLVFDSVGHTASRELVDANAQLIRCALPEMERLHHAFGAADWSTVCVNADGVVVQAVGGLNGMARELARGLWPGANLSEKQVGTNAPGCALAEERPVVIRGSEHFLDQASPFICAAVPLLGPGGQLAGALNVSQLHGFGQRDILDLLMTAARATENRMFADLRDVVVVRFHHRLDMVATPYAALLAVAPDGSIVGANRAASGILCLPGTSIVGLYFPAMFDLSLANLRTQSDRHVPSILFSNTGLCVYAMLHDSANEMDEPSASKRPFASSSVTADVSRETPEGATVRNLPGTGQSVTDRAFLGDPQLRKTLEKAQRTFDRDVPVVIHGETGTGKEVFAQLLHERGPRRAGAFVAINCSALPAGLIESELFGYEHGAFTGGRRGGASGKFEEANNGTLFLDEIGDMPLDLQGRLLRVLQERCVTRLGSSRAIPINVSLVCATHRSLPELLAAGGFREDLFYRINGFSVTLPPLREREDRRELVEWCLVTESAGAACRFSPFALRILLAYPWPGNVRQLRSVLRAAVALASEGGEITTEHLPAELADYYERHRADALPELLPGRTLASTQAERIRQAMLEHNGNISAAARSLGIARATLYRKLRNL